MFFLIWLILRPQHPVYKVVDVYISHINYRNSTFHQGWNSRFHHDRNQTVKDSWKSRIHGGSNSTYRNISITLKIEISNPNKRIGIDHDDIKVALYHSDSFTGNNSVAGFHQGYRNTTFCEVEVKTNQHSWRGIMGRKVDLRICLKSGVHYIYGIFRCRTNRHPMDFDAYRKLRFVPDDLSIQSFWKPTSILSEDVTVTMCKTDNFYLWLLQVVGLLGLVALCLWLAMRPKNPSYTILNLSVPALNDSNASGTGIIQYELDIKNPNEDSGIYYDDILLIFYHGQDRVGDNTIPSFYQGKDKTREVLAHVNVETGLWKALRSAILNATAEIKVDLSTKIKYKTWGMKSKHHDMHREGKVPIGKDGKIANKKKKVKLRRGSKKWKVRTTRLL
ncbi:hypothetical protein POUND7_002571 [Theobroma cacao]